MYVDSRKSEERVMSQHPAVAGTLLALVLFVTFIFAGAALA
jgi:hypothetical protein